MAQVKSKRSPKSGWTARDIILSRKLMFAHLSLMVIFVGAILASRYSWSESLFSNFINGIIGVAGIYTTGNVGSKWISAKDKPQDLSTKE